MRFVFNAQPEPYCGGGDSEIMHFACNELEFVASGNLFNSHGIINVFQKKQLIVDFQVFGRVGINNLSPEVGD